MDQAAFTKTLARENAIKNGLAFILSALAFPTITRVLTGLDALAISDFILFVSVLLATVCFANFAFTYDKKRMQLLHGRLFAHATTFIFMFLIAVMLESMTIGVHIIYPTLSPLIVPMTFLLYIGLAMYDFWDLLRVETNE